MSTRHGQTFAWRYDAVGSDQRGGGFANPWLTFPFRWNNPIVWRSLTCVLEVSLSNEAVNLFLASGQRGWPFRWNIVPLQISNICRHGTCGAQKVLSIRIKFTSALDCCDRSNNHGTCCGNSPQCRRQQWNVSMCLNLCCTSGLMFAYSGSMHSRSGLVCVPD